MVFESEVQCDYPDAPDGEMYTAIMIFNDCSSFDPKMTPETCDLEVCVPVNALWDWCAEYPWVPATILIITGAIILFFGQMLFKPVIMIKTVIVVTLLTFALFYGIILPDDTPIWTVWAVLAGGIVLGIIAGIFVLKLIKLAVVIAAALAGCILGLLLNEAFIYLIKS